MAMSDCPKCWETPCCCGHEYKDWSISRITKFINTLQDIRTKKIVEEYEKAQTWEGPGNR